MSRRSRGHRLCALVDVAKGGPATSALTIAEAHEPFFVRARFRGRLRMESVLQSVRFGGLSVAAVC